MKKTNSNATQYQNSKNTFLNTFLARLHKLKKKSKLRLPYINSHYILMVIFILSTLCFSYWFYTSILRIAFIEAKYHTQILLKDTNLKYVLVPDFSTDVRGMLSHHKQAGLYIPKIFVDSPIIYNTDAGNKQEYLDSLKQGIAHAAGTSLPDGDGLGYYFAHSSTPALVGQYNAIFYLLGKLEPGDDIYLWYQNQKYHYQVDTTQITTPDDLAFLKNNQESLVLQTCWPPGTTQKRLLVFAKKI